MDTSGTTMPSTAVIIAGGDPIDARALDRLPHPAYVVAADSGLDQAYRLGLDVDLIIGDLDSVSPEALDRSRSLGVPVEEHPVDKDATDLELALDHAMIRGSKRAVLFGGHGGRLSHLLGNALVLTAEKYAALDIEWHVAATTVVVARPRRTVTLEGSPGDLVSLLATGGVATGVTTSGLRWALADAQLEPGSTHGISNEMTSTTARVELGDGVLLTIHERAGS